MRSSHNQGYTRLMVDPDDRRRRAHTGGTDTGTFGFATDVARLGRASGLGVLVHKEVL